MEATSVVPVRVARAVLVVLAVAGATAVQATYPGHSAEVASGLAVELVASSLFARARLPALGIATVGIGTAALVAVSPVWRDAVAAGLVFWIAPAVWLTTADLLVRSVRPVGLGIGALGWVAHLVVTVRADPTVTGVLAALAPVLGGGATAAAFRLRSARRERIRMDADRRQLKADRARFEERSGLAETMHELVSHRLTHLVILARTLADDTVDQMAAERARLIEDTAVGTLASLRDTLRQLTGGTSSPPTDPRRMSAADSLAEIDAFVADARGLGEDVVLDVQRDPAVAGLPAPTGQALSRVVQEGLVNARKHAPGARVRVAVRLGHDVSVVVSNDAPRSPPDTDLAATGSGTGLRGLHRRISLLGGRFSAHGCDDGGYVLGVHFDDVVAAE